jgi:tetratricopeptide (TPR) repeat protein
MGSSVIKTATIFVVASSLLSLVADGSSLSTRRSGHSHRTISRHRVARRGQGPTQDFDEIFPPGHRFTPEEKAEASALGVLCENGLWKDAYKAATKAVKQHPERWWLYAAQAAAAANLNRPKDVIDAVDHALQTNNGDANRLNICQLQILKANALSRMGRQPEAVNAFLVAARTDPKDPFSRAGAAWLYATSNNPQIRNPALALKTATEASELSHQREATILDVLATSYAANGDYVAAQHWEGKAVLAGESGDIPQFQRRLLYFQSNKPWTEDSR